MKKLLKNLKGATAIEYALIAGLISIAIIAGATSLGSSVSSTFSTISTEVDKVM